MDKLSLCIASPSFYPIYGGAQLRFARYIPSFEKNGLDVYVFTGLHPISGEESVLAQKADRKISYGSVYEENVDGIKVRKVSLPSMPRLLRTVFYNHALLATCRDIERRPQVLQLVGRLRPLSLYWIKAIKSLGIPICYAITIFSEKKLGIGKAWDFRRKYFRKLYNSLDCIIVNSPAMKSALADLGISTRVEVIRNGVDVKRFLPAPERESIADLRRELGIDKDSVVLISIGAIIPRKGCDLLIEAWDRLCRLCQGKDIHLIFVGPRRNQTKPELLNFNRRIQKILCRSSNPEHVHFIGVVKNVEDYLRISDIFVLPSKREGTPNSMLEAMAVGLPVVITPFDGLSDDLGEPGRDFILVNREARELADALYKLINDEAYKESIGVNGRKWVIKNHNMDAVIQRYVGLYRDLSNKFS